MAAEASEVSLEKDTGNVEENGVVEKVEENMEDLKLETDEKPEPPPEEEIGKHMWHKYQGWKIQEKSI